MNDPKWPKGPYYFLEAEYHSQPEAVGDPLTVCDPDDVDLANIYSSDNATVPTTREQAVALAHLFAASPRLYAALDSVMREIVGEQYTGRTDVDDEIIENAWAALKQARGEEQ